MGMKTEIAWCDSTFNCWWGCTKVGGSPACDGCYAERDSKRYGFDIWGSDAPRRYFGEKHFNELLKWDKDAQVTGEMRRVFVMSMGDWAEGRPEQAPYLDLLWDRFLKTKNLIFLMLTKRPQLINKLCPLGSQRIWHGVTAENQHWLDIRWPILRDVGSEVYWLSVEPMIGPMVLPDDFLRLGKRAWCIVGGESGPKARPMSSDWVRRLRDQCVEAGVPYFMKQWGEWCEWDQLPEDIVRELDAGGEQPRDTPFRVGKRAAGHLLDGQSWRQMPEVRR